MRGAADCLTWASMNRTTILKGMAICSSILLAGCFVAYRQKQASAPAAEDEPIVMPGSKSPGSGRLLPGSKNIDAIFAPGQSGSSNNGPIPADPEEFEALRKSRSKEAEKVLLPSSKNIDAILRNPSQQKPSPVPAKPGSSRESGDGKTLLPSSKIGAILTPKDVTEEKAVEPAPEPGEEDNP